MTLYRLTSAKHHHVLVIVCLNRVNLDGYASPDEAIAKLIELGYSPELRYQLNPQRGEFDTSIKGILKTSQIGLRRLQKR